MQEMQARLDATIIEGVSGAGLVRLTVNGQGALKGIKIDPKLADPNDIEMLEDLIIAAHADAKAKLDHLKETEMKNAAGGLTLPPGMKLPF
jgi:DNA-binding YbaB/EbfC family protein